MYWMLSRVPGEDDTPGVHFDETSVQTLLDIGRDLRWVGGVDPYRDTRIAGEDLPAVGEELEVLSARYEQRYLDAFARSKDTTRAALEYRPYLAREGLRRLRSDGFHQALEGARALVALAQETGRVVEIQGT